MATVDVAVLSERLRTTHRAAALAAEAAVLKHAQEIDHFHHYQDEVAHGVKITMMQRHIAGQPDVYLGRATLAITPEKALQALEDMGRRLEWDATYDFDHGRNFCVFTEGDTTFDIYREAHQAMLGGWISPREMVNARVVRRFPDGSLNQCFTSVIDDACPELPNFVRASCQNSGMLFKKLDAGHCELQYVLQVDPRGRIPTWASSRAVATSMFDLIKFVLRVGQE